MNLALRDVSRRLPRFIGTAAGLGLLFAVVISMQGIYAGLVDDATILTRSMGADLWVVQRGTRGPFAEASRLDSAVESRVAAVPGVRTARGYTYQLIQPDHLGTPLRMALVGIAWPDDRGESLPLVAGRLLGQSHGEVVVDASLGLAIGDSLTLAREPYRVIGLTRNALTSGGDAVVFMTVSDAQLVAADAPAESILMERARSIERLRATDLGRAQPGLEDLLADARWRPPALPAPSLSAVLVRVDPTREESVRRTIQGWGDVTVYSQRDEENLLLQGVVERARMQLGLFSVILTVTAGVIVMMVLFTMTIEKTHDIAVLKLLGARPMRLASMVLQQSWLLGAVAYGIAFALGQVAYQYFPRRVVLTPAVYLMAPAAILAVTTLASFLGIAHALRVDASRVLEG